NARKMKEEPDGCDKSPQRVAPTRVCFFMRQHKSQIIWGESLEQSLREINTWLQHSQHERLRLLNRQHATAGEGAGRCPLESAVSVGPRRTSVAKRKPRIATREKKNENNNSRLIDGCDESLCLRQKSAGPDRSQSATEAVKIIVVKNSGVRAAA